MRKGSSPYDHDPPKKYHQRALLSRESKCTSKLRTTREEKNDKIYHNGEENTTILLQIKYSRMKMKNIGDRNNKGKNNKNWGHMFQKETLFDQKVC